VVEFTAHKAFTTQVGSLLDNDPNGVASDYTAHIIWGDGSASTGVVAGSGGGGGWTISGSHTYAQAKRYNVNVVVKDHGGAKASTGTTAATLVVTVPSASAHQGVTFSGNIAKFVDLSYADPQCGFTSYNATIKWGDGTTSGGGISFNGNCASGFNVLGSHTYTNTGTFKLIVLVTGNNGAGGKGTGHVTVSP
jgi:hypothetical protein